MRGLEKNNMKSGHQKDRHCNSKGLPKSSYFLIEFLMITKKAKISLHSFLRLKKCLEMYNLGFKNL